MQIRHIRIAALAAVSAGAIVLSAVAQTGPDTNTPAVATASNAEAVQAPASASDAAAEGKEDGRPDTGFTTDGEGILYYKNGEPLKDTSLLINGKLYLFDEDGHMLYGWQERYGLLYYFDRTGASETGWIEDGDSYYCLRDHKKLTGWHTLEWDGTVSDYYFDEDGVMLEDCETPDGYYVAKGGAWDGMEPRAYDGEGFSWNKDTADGAGQVSGLVIADMPAEFYMLSIAGETSGMANGNALVNGDRGRAYGACQFDYRYDLVDFMRFAYGKHPDLWPGFAEFTGYGTGDPALVGNEAIGRVFTKAMEVDYETCISDQMEFVRQRYWDGFASAMDAAGYRLSERHPSVSAAFLSVNVNCGTHTTLFLNSLSPDMTDEEIIRKIYELRNTAMADENVGGVKKGTSNRYRSCEPQMALDLLYGYTTIDSHVNYGGGVEWHGNPFTGLVTTVALEGEIRYEDATASDAEAQEEADDTLPEGEASEAEETAPVIVSRKAAERMAPEAGGPGVAAERTKNEDATMADPAKDPTEDPAQDAGETGTEGSRNPDEKETEDSGEKEDSSEKEAGENTGNAGETA